MLLQFITSKPHSPKVLCTTRLSPFLCKRLLQRNDKQFTHLSVKMGILLSPGPRSTRQQQDSELSPAHRRAGEATEPIMVLAISSLQQGTESLVLYLSNLKSRFRLLYLYAPLGVRQDPTLWVTLSKDVGLLCQPKLSSSSQIPLGNWRNDTLPSCLWSLYTKITIRLQK